jgi:hypothetical protein
MALRSTQPLTQMSTTNFPEGKGRQAGKADNLTAICQPIVQKMREPRRLTTLWNSTASFRDSFILFSPELYAYSDIYTYIYIRILLSGLTTDFQ